MSGGLFGYTSFFPETTIDETKQLKAGQGYKVQYMEHSQIYGETKDKYQELLQPMRKLPVPDELNSFPINDIGRTMDGTYRLNASFYNGLDVGHDDKSYGREKYIPEAYPNRYYNTQKFSPGFLALNNQNKDDI